MDARDNLQIKSGNGHDADTTGCGDDDLVNDVAR
jgi:hypothetical protein